MKRSLVFTAALVFSALALTISSPLGSRTARADELKKDRCPRCQAKVQRDYEKCVAEQGGETAACGDLFNQGIVECFATVCEG